MKLSAGSAVGSAQITDDSIVNADINSAAAIALSKLATDPVARANHTGTQAKATISDYPAQASQAEAEAGTETAAREMTPQRVKQAIDALGAGGTKLEASGADTRISNPTAETNFFSVSVPANTLGTNNAVRAKIYLTDIDFHTGATFTFRFKYGATTIASLAIGGGSGTVINFLGTLEVILFANAATNAQSGFIDFQLGLNQTDPGITTAVVRTYGLGSGTAAEDSTAVKNLIVSVQSNESNAADGFTRRGYIVEKITA